MLIRPKGNAVDGGCAFQNSRTRVCIYFCRGTAVPKAVTNIIPVDVFTWDEINNLSALVANKDSSRYEACNLQPVWHDL